ncbi:MAG TPA: DUF4197 domain-containing protein [Chitinophagaceae bacterium]|nr:DUF4197 domain-containing protein [Chitinophagaceae bacterium]
MKKIFAALLLLPATYAANAQGINGILNKAKKAASESGSMKTTQSPGSSKQPVSTNLLGNDEIASGLREALKLGAQTATKNLSATNGFFGNQLIKILMPPEVAAIEAKMRQFGMGNVVDKAILSMNRAAEDASAQALPILVNTITSFTIQDGLSILNGGDNAATNLLRTRTTPQITAAFRPVISKSMSKYNVEQAWTQVFSTYNSLPIIKNKVNTDLTGYITERALSGLFTSIGQEEKKIRLDPVGTGSDIIGRVFGSKR